MQFDLMSDLHVDLSPSAQLDWAAMATSPIAVIAGDISNKPEITIKTLERMSQHYDKVLFVDGNHEHYSNRSDSVNQANRMPPQTYAMLRKAFEGHDKVVYLDQGRQAYIQDGVAFVGANSWYEFVYSDVDPDLCKRLWWTEMNDSKWANIDAWWVENECVRQSANILATVASLNQNSAVKKIVLVTHTVPSMRAIRELNHQWTLLNGCYYNGQLGRTHFGKVVAHCFGHTHHRQMFREHAIDFYCNPRGYSGEPGFYKWEPMIVNLEDQFESAFGQVER